MKKEYKDYNNITDKLEVLLKKEVVSGGGVMNIVDELQVLSLRIGLNKDTKDKCLLLIKTCKHNLRLMLTVSDVLNISSKITKYK